MRDIEDENYLIKKISYRKILGRSRSKSFKSLPKNWLTDSSGQETTPMDVKYDVFVYVIKRKKKKMRLLSLNGAELRILEKGKLKDAFRLSSNTKITKSTNPKSKVNQFHLEDIVEGWNFIFSFRNPQGEEVSFMKYLEISFAVSIIISLTQRTNFIRKHHI